MTDLAILLRALRQSDADFIVVGGVAGIAHGAARLTEDLDIVYRRDRENISCIVRALEPFEPYPRGAPPGLPFVWHAQTLWNGLNFTLRTTAGDIDVLGEISGAASYEELDEQAVEIDVFGVRCKCLRLAKLIDVKRAAGRPKDFEAIAELEALEEETDDTDGYA